MYNFEMTMTFDTMIFGNVFKAGISTATVDNYVWNKTHGVSQQFWHQFHNINPYIILANLEIVILSKW